jgi:hypothetical protein
MRRPPLRAVAGWVVAVAAAAAFGGPVPAAVAAGLAAWHLVRPPRARTLTVAAAAVFAVVPVMWILGNGDRLGLASPQVVLGNRLPGTLASVALLLLVVGVLRDTASTPRPAVDTQGGAS